MNRIEQLRREKGLSQQQLAEEMNVHQTAVSQWEKGRTTPNLELVCDLCDFFDVDMGFLLGNSDIRGKFRKTEEELEALGKLEAEEQIIVELRTKMNSYYDKLNLKGQEKAVAYVEDLSKVLDYQIPPQLKSPEK